ncbi:MAG TPA: hypothetical protein H9727_00985 [Candidatus Borkfalkia avistercoris]|uniref:Uncharacterized protein n=1 Tax=Candidatus Borkfalkia avistercoris TaxID=2838504 RepID=A0A9D2CY19_9FIRM|nr:hypothetical protein [Candidatus Borkfalkia avistercoris]
MNDGVKEALRRRALGFEAEEVVEEYAFQEGEAVLLKRKVTKKTVPPDVAAAKLLSEEEKPLAALTPRELQEQKARLLALLREGEEK